MRDARVERSKVGLVLEYKVCSSCGRNEYVALLINAQVIACGSEAQRKFISLDEPRADTVTRHVALPIDEPDPLQWNSPDTMPRGDMLIQVAFKAGGGYIECTSFFADRWALVEGWRPYDNRPALAASFIERPIPAAYRVDTVGTEPIQRAKAARPIPSTSPVLAVPVGGNFSLF